MFSIKKLENVNLKGIIIFAFTCFMFLLTPEISFASTGEVQSKLSTGATAIQTVLTGIVAVVGIVAALKIVVKHLPGLDDPHVKNEMWKSIGAVLLAVAAGAALVWLVPWMYSLFV